ncbi:MAG: hypothetical protein ACE5JP_15545 [Candidatus Bipolaricaulia bacterium]
MRRLLIIGLTTGLLLSPWYGFAEDASQAIEEGGQAVPVDTGSSDPPPIAQHLVRESAFAQRLLEALHLGTGKTEAEAQNTLASVGIAPKNGWISNYPVTPDILGELKLAVGEAADAGRITMTRDEAEQALTDLVDAFDLPIRMVSTDVEQPREEDADTLKKSVKERVIEDYYDEEGPPVVTYYPPPRHYAYLYGWVPYPFYWDDYSFPGYFILHDFHVVLRFGHHRHHRHHHGGHHARVDKFERRVVSNHFVGSRTRRLLRVDPVTRQITRTSRASVSVARHDRGFRSVESRRSASSILRRNVARHSSVQSANTAGVRSVQRNAVGSGSRIGSRRSVVGDTSRSRMMSRRSGEGRTFSRQRKSGSRDTVRMSRKSSVGRRAFRLPSRSLSKAFRASTRNSAEHSVRRRGR